MGARFTGRSEIRAFRPPAETLESRRWRTREDSPCESVQQTKVYETGRSAAPMPRHVRFRLSQKPSQKTPGSLDVLRRVMRR
jgi:hypothetical protein